jgi:transposase
MNRGPKGRYTKEFREQAVKLVLVGGLSQREVAGRLSLSVKTLGAWVVAERKGTLTKVGETQKPQSELEAELARVKRELATVTMERDILKKATARSTGRCNTFWSNVGPGGKVGESETKMRVISCTKNVVVAEMERW